MTKYTIVIAVMRDLGFLAAFSGAVFGRFTPSFTCSLIAPQKEKRKKKETR
jgi:hypothetical protein